MPEQSQQTTPAIGFELTSPFAGYLRYHPWRDLTARQRDQFTDILIDAEMIEDGENQETLCDWRLVTRSKEQITVRSEVVLYRDGGDAEDPAVLFYRRDLTADMDLVAEWIHIPPQDQQKTLHEAGMEWIQNPEGGYLTQMTDYLLKVMEDPTAWVSLATLLAGSGEG